MTQQGEPGPRLVEKGISVVDTFLFKKDIIGSPGRAVLLRIETIEILIVGAIGLDHRSWIIVQTAKENGRDLIRQDIHRMITDHFSQYIVFRRCLQSVGYTLVFAH